MSDNIIARLFKAITQANADDDGSLLVKGSINVVNAVHANDGL